MRDSDVSIHNLHPQMADFRHYFDGNKVGASYVLVLTSVNALSYNLVHSQMIKRTSAVTTTVLGMVKIVGLLLLSAMLLGESRALSMAAVVGCIIALIGFGMYSKVRLEEMRASHPVQLISLDLEDSKPAKVGA